MRSYHFDFEPERTRRAVAIPAFERAGRRGWPPPPRRGVVDLLLAAAALIRQWRQRTREREQLATLDYRTLRDIGITPGEAERECNKPFWRA